MEAIERFHFMHTAVAGLSSSGGMSMMYAAAARDLTNEADTQKRAKALQDFQTKIKGRRPEKESFITGFSELRYSNAETRNKALVRYILERFDIQIRQDAAINYSSMTIEHVGSQNPKGAPALSQYAEIGNLVLVSEELNGKLKNKSFVEKKKIMKEAGLPLDPTLATANDWDDATIERRTDAIAKALFIA
jgi:hypothetical protein